jgi:lipopolysaccharide exporter
MLRKLSANSGLVRNILTLFTGSTIAQAIPVMISPILTRMYPVADFATLTVVTTLISLVGVIVCGRYEIGIGLPADDKQAKQLVYLSMIVSVMVSAFSFVVLIFFRHPIASILKNPDAANYFLLVPIAALVYGLFQALSYWNIRKRNYLVIASAKISQSIVNSGVSLGYAFSGLGFNGLIFGNISGLFAALGYSWFRVKPEDELSFKKSDVDLNEIKSLANKYSDLPRINGMHALSDMMNSSLVIFLISGFFGTVATGLYGLTMRILQAPLNMIGNSFAIVFYKEVAEKISKKQKITKLLRSTITTLTFVSLPVFVVIMIGGPTIFEFVFGAQWRDAGIYVRILSPWLFLNFIASPISHLPVILGKQRQFFMFSLLGNIAVVLSLAAGAYFFENIIYGLILVASTQVLFQASMILYFIFIASNSEKEVQSS